MCISYLFGYIYTVVYTTVNIQFEAQIYNKGCISSIFFVRIHLDVSFYASHCRQE